jgi:hypothetical protein
MRCGKIAPSWFHTDFVMFSDGFVCIDCLARDNPDWGIKK